MHPRSANRFASNVVAIAVLIVLGTQELAQPQAGRFTVSVTTLNVEERSDTTGAEQSVRLRELGRRFESLVPFWNFVALQELLATKNQRWPWSPQYMTAKPVPCGPADAAILPVACFERGIANNPADLFHQYGQNGFIAAQWATSIVPGSIRDASIGAPVGDTIQRHITGARFNLRYVNAILPLYSVHLNASVNDMTRYRSELNDLVSKVRGWHRPGDLTPVVAGDFNCSQWTPDVRKLMYNHFVPASEDADAIDIIWVGRPDSFPGSAGALRRRGRSLRDSSMKDADLTDHNLISSVLEFDPATSLQSLPPPAMVNDRGCYNEFTSVRLNGFDFNPQSGNYDANWPGPPRRDLTYADVKHYVPFFNIAHFASRHNVRVNFWIKERQTFSDTTLGFFSVDFRPANEGGMAIVTYLSAVGDARTPTGAPQETTGTFWLGCTRAGKVRGNEGRGDDGYAEVYLERFNIAQGNFSAPARSPTHVVRCR